MTGSQSIRFLKARSYLVSLLAIAPFVMLILGLTACVEYPVGDPEKSQVDERFTGIWLNTGESNDHTLLLLRPYDSRTYYATVFSFRRGPSGIEPSSMMNYKAWLTPLGKATFLTMEPLGNADFAGLTEKPPYLAAKVMLSDGVLTLRLVNGASELAKPADSSDELEAVIAQHAESDALYADSGTSFHKTDDKPLIASVLKAFCPDGCEVF